ncbi:MAG: hypothetical protein ACYC5M_18445 [Anaerolineae bacterium]
MSDSPLRTDRPPDEKTEEKTEEKRGDRQEKEEKSTEEKYRRDPVGTLTWAVILIWAGIVFLLENLGALAGLTNLGRDWFGFPGFSIGTWSLILIGAGVAVLGSTVIRALMPAYRRPVGGDAVFGIILLAVGLGGIVGWGLVWPLALIAGGIAILLGGLVGRR